MALKSNNKSFIDKRKADSDIKESLKKGKEVASEIVKNTIVRGKKLIGHLRSKIPSK